MPNSNKLLFFSAVAFFSFFSAVAAFARVMEDVAATVNGKPILLSEYKRNLRSVTDQYEKNLPDLLKKKSAVEEIRRKVLDQMVDDELLVQHARKENIKVRKREIEAGIQEIKERFSRDESGNPLSPEEAGKAFRAEVEREGLTFVRFRDRIERQIMIRKLIEEKVQSVTPPPPEEEVRAYFGKMEYLIKGDTSVLAGFSPLEQQHFEMLSLQLKESFSERVRVRHVLAGFPHSASMAEKSTALKKIGGVQKKLEKGEDFADMAGAYSDDRASAQRGGDLGFFIRGMMVPEFEKAAFSLDVGKVSDIVETKFGYHILRVEEKRAARKLRFEEVRAQLSRAMFALSVQKRLQKMVGDLRAKARIETF